MRVKQVKRNFIRYDGFIGHFDRTFQALFTVDQSYPGPFSSSLENGDEGGLSSGLYICSKIRTFEKKKKKKGSYQLAVSTLK